MRETMRIWEGQEAFHHGIWSKHPATWEAEIPMHLSTFVMKPDNLDLIFLSYMDIYMEVAMNQT